MNEYETKLMIAGMIEEAVGRNRGRKDWAVFPDGRGGYNVSVRGGSLTYPEVYDLGILISGLDLEVDWGAESKTQYDRIHLRPFNRPEEGPKEVPGRPRDYDRSGDYEWVGGIRRKKSKKRGSR